MGLQDFYYLTGGIAFIVITIFLVTILVVVIFVADRLEKILNTVHLIVRRSAETSSTVQYLIGDITDRVRRVLRLF